MKILHKMLIGYLLIALIAAMTGLFGSWGVKRLNRNFTEVSDEILPLQMSLDSLRYAGMLIVSSTLELTFEPFDQLASEKEKQEESAQLQEGYELYDASMRSCRAMMESVPTEEPILREIEASGLALKSASQKFLGATKRRADSRTLYEARSEFEHAERLFLATVTKASDEEKRELALSKGNVGQGLRWSFILLPTLSILALILAIFVGTRISSSISRRLESLRQGLNQVKTGNLTAPRLIDNSSDEIADLSASFNRMVEELRDSKENLSSTTHFLDRIIHSMADALLVITPEGAILSANQTAETMLDCAREELTARSLLDFFAAEQEGKELLTGVVKEGVIKEFETSFTTASGTLVPVSISSSLIESTPGYTNIVCIAHDMTKRKLAESKIKNLAYFDQLTGLANRTLLHDRLSQSMAGAKREGGMLALFVFDLDRFKDVNDTLGHSCGDILLQVVADRVTGIVRKSDTFARIGGDEFALLCNAVHNEESVALVANKLLQLFTSPFYVQDNELYISASLGIVLFPNDGEDLSSLFKNADLALYEAKEQGRNTFRFFSEEMNQRAQYRSHLETRLRRAVQLEEFYLAFQPQIDLKNGRLFGVEALIRWNDPELGQVPPSLFIPVAEQTGMIRPIGDWLLRRVCSVLKRWNSAGFTPVRMAVNVSACQLQYGFIDEVLRVIGESSVDPALLELEMTETMLMNNPRESAEFLQRLKQHKIHISVDDFGTGYSSLSYLKDFPIDRLKIDRSFISNIIADSDSATIVNAVISLGHSLGLKVLAEGVERPDELEYLMGLGCDEAQGYLLGYPMPLEEVEKLFGAEIPLPFPNGGGCTAEASSTAINDLCN